MKGSLNRSWHDTQAIARTRAVTRANQEKESLGEQCKARTKVELRGLISPVQNSK